MGGGRRRVQKEARSKRWVGHLQGSSLEMLRGRGRPYAAETRKRNNLVCAWWEGTLVEATPLRFDLLLPSVGAQSKQWTPFTINTT